MRAALPTFLLLASLAPGAEAASRSKNAGTSGAEFLKLGADARGGAMGLAMTAASDDASSVHWNPAGLSQVAEVQISGTFSQMYQDVQYGFLALAAPIKSPVAPRRREYRPSGSGTVAAALLYLNAGPLQERDNTGALTGGRLTPQDFAAMAGWGATLTEDLDLGVSMKYIQSRIQATAQTAAGDAGARYRMTLADWPYVFALSAHNLGGKLRFRRQQDPLPSSVRIGQSLRPARFLLLACDVVFPRDNGVYPALGAEATLPLGEDTRFDIRGGYSGRTSSGDLDGTTGLTFGFGMRFSGTGFDYAWLPYGVLGQTHRFTFNYRFGR